MARAAARSSLVGKWLPTPNKLMVVAAAPVLCAELSAPVQVSVGLFTCCWPLSLWSVFGSAATAAAAATEVSAAAASCELLLSSPLCFLLSVASSSTDADDVPGASGRGGAAAAAAASIDSVSGLRHRSLPFWSWLGTLGGQSLWRGGAGTPPGVGFPGGGTGEGLRPSKGTNPSPSPSPGLSVGLRLKLGLKLDGGLKLDPKLGLEPEPGPGLGQGRGPVLRGILGLLWVSTWARRSEICASNRPTFLVTSTFWSSRWTCTICTVRLISPLAVPPAPPPPPPPPPSSSSLPNRFRHGLLSRRMRFPTFTPSVSGCLQGERARGPLGLGTGGNTKEGVGPGDPGLVPVLPGLKGLPPTLIRSGEKVDRSGTGSTGRPVRGPPLLLPPPPPLPVPLLLLLSPFMLPEFIIMGPFRAHAAIVTGWLPLLRW